MDPPHFREATSEMPSCGTCEFFSNVGFCGKYQRPMFPDELCDSFVSILRTGKRRVAGHEVFPVVSGWQGYIRPASLRVFTLITRISARNFGCFGDGPYEVNLTPLTFMVGPNNIGKSTMLAAYATVAWNNFHAPLTKFYEYGDAAFGHGRSKGIVLEVTGNFDGKVASRFVAYAVNTPMQGVQVQSSIGSSSGNVSYQYGAVGLPGVIVELGKTLSQTWYLLADRVFIPPVMTIGGPQQVFEPRANNLITFLLERWTSRDKLWEEAESWLRKIDPQMTLLKSPLRGQMASVETSRRYGKAEIDVNVSLQGGGIQRAIQIVCAVVFSPAGSVVMIEEPEMNLHEESQRVIVDLFNKAVNDWGKQIIITTHSWDMILPIYDDIGMQAEHRRSDGVKTDATKFSIARFSRKEDDIRIDSYDLTQKKYTTMKEDFHLLWG